MQADEEEEQKEEEKVSDINKRRGSMMHAGRRKQSISIGERHGGVDFVCIELCGGLWALAAAAASAASSAAAAAAAAAAASPPVVRSAPRSAAHSPPGPLTYHTAHARGERRTTHLPFDFYAHTRPAENVLLFEGGPLMIPSGPLARMR